MEVGKYLFIANVILFCISSYKNKFCIVLYCIARNLTPGKQTDLILLDFSKAFNGVNHLKLLYKLQLHGVQGRTLGWIESFLFGRTQCVVIGGDSPIELPVSYGVPQGSDLGLILFLLNINDLSDNIQYNVRLFADDTAVYLTVQGQEDAVILQDDLNVLQGWGKSMGCGI